MTDTNQGAIPSLDTVLGAPESKTKAKTNVGKLAVVGLILTGFLFILAGLLIYQRHKQKVAEASGNKPASLQQQKPGYAQKNAALESDSIDRAKAEIKKKEDEEKARLKALEEAQAEAKRKAEAEAAAKGQLNVKPGQPTPQGPQAPQGPTPHDRKMTGGVLLDNSGARPRTDGQQPAVATSTTSADQQQKDVQSRMNALGVQPGGTTGGTLAAPQGGESLASRLQPTALQARSAGKLPNLDFLLKRGTSIPCALETGIKTTLPGIVICEVLVDVYSANGNTKLVERGAMVFGEQQSSLKQGQERTFVIWTRIDNPGGVSANVDSPATDQMGYSGIEGEVDSFFFKRFGGAILLSVIRDFSQAAAQKASGSSGMNMQYGNSQQATNDMATEALRNSINIPPVLTVKPATVVHIVVARDITFENVYGLSQ